MRRHVLFIAGFDPKGPGHYQAVYTREAALQARVNGLAMQIGLRRNVSGRPAAAWEIEADDGGTPVRTHYELLRWDDLVRAHWQRGAWRVWWQAAQTAWRVARCGSMTKMFALSRPVVIAAMCPLWAGALALLLALAIGSVGAALAIAGGASSVVAIAGGVLVATLLTTLAVHALDRLQLGWFSRLVRFVGRHSRGEIPEADERLDAFAARIVEAAAEAPDELLIVGHSVGGNLAIAAIARALRRDPALTRRAGRVSLLTLGQCVAMTSTLDTATGFHQELRRVAAADIDWLDVSSPLDWASFPLTDPLAGLRERPPADDWHPRIVSPRFHLLLGPAAFAQLRARRFLVHLQYLKAAECPGRYDYFAITAGARTLRQRFDAAPDADT